MLAAIKVMGNLPTFIQLIKDALHRNDIRTDFIISH